MFKLSQINNKINFFNFYKEIGGNLKYSYLENKCYIVGTKVQADYINHDDIIDFSNKNNLEVSYAYNMWYGCINMPKSINITFTENNIFNYINPFYYLVENLKNKKPDELHVNLK